MKKIVALLLSLLLVLSACSALAEKGFTYMGHIANIDNNNEEAFPALWRQFVTDHPEYKLTYIGNAGTDEQMTKIKLAAESGTLPDVFWCLDATAKELQKQGYLMDLSTLLANNPDVKTNLPASMLFTQNGVTYGLPFACNIEGFWYNKKVFDANGVTVPTQGTTFDQLLEMVRTFKAAGVTTIANGAQSPYSCWAMLGCWERFGYEAHLAGIQAGTDKWLNDDFIAYMTNLKALADAGAFAENMTTNDYSKAAELFNAGKAAIFDSGSWSASSEGVIAMGQDIGFWWGPTFSNGVGNQKVSIKIPSAPICVSAAVADDPEKLSAVGAFLNWYYSQKAGEQMVSLGFLPAINLQGEVKSDSYALNAILSALSDTTWISPSAGPDMVLSTAMQNAMYDAVYGVMGGVYTPEQALQLMDSAQAEE